MTSETLADADYQRLLGWRDGLRRFLKWSADRAKEVGLSPAQHQLLLVIRGNGHPVGPTVGEIAGHLLIRHNSAVEQVDRCERLRLVERLPDPDDQRSVRVALTAEGARRLEGLSELHLAELRRLAPQMSPMWAGLEEHFDSSSEG